MVASSNRVYSLTDNRADFGFKIDFARDTEDPARVFRAFEKLIDFCEFTDKALIKALDIELESSLILDNIVQGSIIIWLKNIFSIDENQSHQNINLKKISLYLVNAKSSIINFINTRNTINSPSELTELQTRLKESATSTEVNPLGIYTPSSTQDLLASIDKFQTANDELQEVDKLFYLIREQPSVPINRDFSISSEQKENLLTGETLQSEIEMILKVKKPDYLGESKWEFKHEKRTINVKIQDLEWLSKFRNREVSVVPGDAIKAIVQVISKYDFSGEVISIQYSIQKVIEVIPMPPESQLSLFKDV